MCNWILERHTGKHFAGMPGPNITGDGWTTGLMADAGMRYHAVWVYDERPSPPLAKTGARLVALPHSYESNDVPLLMRSHMEGADYAERCIAHFDWLYEEADSDGRMMRLPLPPNRGGTATAGETSRSGAGTCAPAAPSRAT